MNKRTFLPGMTLCALLALPAFVQATPKQSLTNRQLQAIIKTLREPKTLVGLGISAVAMMIGLAAYKLIRRADTTVHHTGLLTANAAEMTSNIALLLKNPELLKNDELRGKLTEIFATIAERSVASYVKANAAVEAEAATKAAQPAQQSTIMQILTAIIHNVELRQLIQDTIVVATKTYAKEQFKAQAAQPVSPTNESSTITQTIAALAAHPKFVATATYNLAKGYASAEISTGPTIAEQQPTQSKPWFFTRWIDAILARYTLSA